MTQCHITQIFLTSFIFNMFWNLLIASFVIASVCAVNEEYPKIYSDEELLEKISDSIIYEEVLPMTEVQLPGACWACKWAMKRLKKQLGNNESQEEIKGKLSRVCDSIGFLRGLCKRFINKHLDTLVEELSTTDDPRTICVNIKVCKPYSSRLMLKLMF